MEVSNNNIILIGMPGCGKSSIGSIIAEKLLMTFYDTDIYIETITKKSISELFLLGEAHFRKIESQAVSEICHKKSAVIATGGGVVTRPENMTLLKQAGIIFYIERPIDMILASSDLTTRPLLAANSKKIYNIYKTRKGLYENYCDYHILNDDSLERTADQIMKIIFEIPRKKTISPTNEN